MQKQQVINTLEDPLLRKNTIREIRNTPPPAPNVRPVLTTSNKTGSQKAKVSTPLKSTQLAAGSVSSTGGTTKVVSTPAGSIIVETSKDVYVNTYEEVVEQRYFANQGDGVLDVGTVIGGTFINDAGSTTKLGFDNGSGFTVEDLGDGIAKVSLTASSTINQNIEVIGTSLGAVDEGYVFAAGTTLTQFVMAISQKTIPPTYTAPTLILSGSPPPTQSEIGTIINPVFSRTFVQNDGGALTANRLYKNSVEISTSFPYTDTGLQLTGTANVFQAQADYLQGPVKNNNMGVPDPAGQIPAGTATSGTLTYIGSRVSFYGTPAATPNSSILVRAMSGQSFNTANNPDVNAAGEDLVPDPNPNYTITIPVGATRVSFAYPDTSRDVASVRYQELAFTEVRDNFTQTTVVVAGANGYAPVSYRVYTYVPVEPFSQEVHYLVFI